MEEGEIGGRACSCTRKKQLFHPILTLALPSDILQGPFINKGCSFISCYVLLIFLSKSYALFKFVEENCVYSSDKDCGDRDLHEPRLDSFPA